MSDLELPYIASIPYSVQIDDSISDAAKIYFGQIVGLSRKFGYIFATDEALAKMKNVNIRNIERWNKALEDAGHITRETQNFPKKDEAGKWGFEKKRKIYINDSFSRKKEPKEENSNNFTEPDKNGGSLEPDKNGGSLEPDKNGGYNKASLNKHLEQQQDVAVFFDCLKEVAIDGHEKVWISKNYDEDTVRHAVAYSTNSNTHIKTSLVQVIKWACATKPKIPTTKQEDEEQNKALALAVREDAIVPEGCNFEVLNKCVEITFGGSVTPFVLTYSESGFSEKFKEALKKYRIYAK